MSRSKNIIREVGFGLFFWGVGVGRVLKQLKLPEYDPGLLKEGRFPSPKVAPKHKDTPCLMFLVHQNYVKTFRGLHIC